jgi:hypothetical protein
VEAVAVPQPQLGPRRAPASTGTGAQSLHRTAARAHHSCNTARTVNQEFQVEVVEVRMALLTHSCFCTASLCEQVRDWVQLAPST